MRRSKGLFALTAVLTSFSLLIGCGMDDAAPRPPDAIAGMRPDTTVETGGDSSVPAGTETSKSDLIKVASPDVHLEEDEPTAALPSSNVDSDSAASPETKPPVPKFNYDVNEPFDPLHPTLMGLTTTSTAESVTARFGEPTEMHMLPDETSSATVYAYPGFSVGISNGAVLFVEVSSPAVNPGLNGFRVGAETGEAIASIGKPASTTEYVLSYEGNGVVLKLDVDPETQKIQSIKLFPDE